MNDFSRTCGADRARLGRFPSFCLCSTPGNCKQGEPPAELSSNNMRAGPCKAVAFEVCRLTPETPLELGVAKPRGLFFTDFGVTTFTSSKF